MASRVRELAAVVAEEYRGDASRIFGGRDLSTAYPWLGQAALYGVDDTIGAAEIDRLADLAEGILT